MIKEFTYAELNKMLAAYRVSGEEQIYFSLLRSFDENRKRPQEFWFSLDLGALVRHSVQIADDTLRSNVSNICHIDDPNERKRAIDLAFGL